MPAAAVAAAQPVTCAGLDVKAAAALDVTTAAEDDVAIEAAAAAVVAALSVICAVLGVKALPFGCWQGCPFHASGCASFCRYPAAEGPAVPPAAPLMRCHHASAAPCRAWKSVTWRKKCGRCGARGVKAGQGQLSYVERTSHLPVRCCTAATHARSRQGAGEPHSCSSPTQLPHTHPTHAPHLPSSARA